MATEPASCTMMASGSANWATSQVTRSAIMGELFHSGLLTMPARMALDLSVYFRTSTARSAAINLIRSLTKGSSAASKSSNPKPTSATKGTSVAMTLPMLL